MANSSFFETAFGRSMIAWGPDGILGLGFPPTDDMTADRIRRRALSAEEGDPTPQIARIVADIVALFRGEKRDLRGAKIDYRGIDDFEREVYERTRAIPPGETKTYGDIARSLGDVALSQRVGQALGRNPYPIVVPCHRVIGADGRMTGFSAPGGTNAKMRLLKLEGGLARDLFD